MKQFLLVWLAVGMAWSGFAMKVAVSLEPQAGILEAVSPEKTEALVLVPGGESPHGFEPKGKALLELSKCDVYFLAGIDFEEHLLEKLRGLAPDMRFVDAAEKGDDYHEWTSPGGQVAIAERMVATLGKDNPAWAERLAAFKKRMAEKDAELRAKWSGKKVFLAYHPAWGAFAEAYGLEQLAVEKDGAEPTPKSLSLLMERVKAEGIQTVWVQSDSEAERVKPLVDALGLEIVRVDPLSRDPETLWGALR